MLIDIIIYCYDYYILIHLNVEITTRDRRFSSHKYTNTSISWSRNNDFCEIMEICICQSGKDEMIIYLKLC